MRTTLDIDQDLLMAAKELAKVSKKTTGKIISELVRKALTQPDHSAALAVRQPEAVYGVRPLARRGGIVTSEMVRKLMDGEGS